jgi:hypothetical protein
MNVRMCYRVTQSISDKTERIIDKSLLFIPTKVPLKVIVEGVV